VPSLPRARARSANTADQASPSSCSFRDIQKYDAHDSQKRVENQTFKQTSEFARVKIVGHTDYDLIAEPA